jgi:hypothetical protein
VASKGYTREEPTGKAQVIDEDSPHACWSGVVWIGEMAWDTDTGDEIEIQHPYLCKRCCGESS